MGFKFKKILSLEDPFFTLKSILYFYLLMKMSILLGDRVLLLAILNIFIFYSPINNKCPHFLFFSRMYFKQIFEGIIGIVECLIPRYVEEKSKKK